MRSGKTKWIDALDKMILNDEFHRYSHEARRVYDVLAKSAHPLTGHTSPSIPTISRQTSLSFEQVYLAINELKDADVIVVLGQEENLFYSLSSRVVTNYTVLFETIHLMTDVQI